MDTRKLKMFTLIGVAGVLAATVLVVGYRKRKSISKGLEKLRGNAKLVGRGIKEYAYEQKEEFVKEIRGQLNDLNEELQKISELLDKSPDEINSNTDHKKKFEILSGQIAKLHLRLDDAKNSTESTWNRLQEESKQTFESVKESVHAAGQWINGKVHSVQS